MRAEDIDFDNILLDKNSNENILIYDIPYKIFMGAKPLRIRFGKLDRIRYLEIFGQDYIIQLMIRLIILL